MPEPPLVDVWIRPVFADLVTYNGCKGQVKYAMALCMSKNKYHKEYIVHGRFKNFFKSTPLSHCDALLKHNKHLKNLILKHATNRMHI